MGSPWNLKAGDFLIVQSWAVNDIGTSEKLTTSDTHLEPYIFPTNPLPPKIRAPTFEKVARNRAEFTWDALPGVSDYNYGYEVHWIEPYRQDWERAFITDAIVHEEINLLTEGSYLIKIRGTNQCGTGEFSEVLELTVDNFYRKMKYFEKLDEQAKKLLPPAAYAVLLRTELEFP
jgi:hypothetical protein